MKALQQQQLAVGLQLTDSHPYNCAGAGARARSPVRDSAAAMGSALQAELDATHYSSELLEQR